MTPEDILIDQIFGELWKGKYLIGWCDMCQGFYITHDNHGGCMSDRCNDCMEDMKEFDSLKHDPFLYLSKEEIEATQKLRRIKQIIKICLLNNIPLIDWAALDKGGYLSDNDHIRFSKELKNK